MTETNQEPAVDQQTFNDCFDVDELQKLSKTGLIEFFRKTMGALKDEADGLQLRCQTYEAKINGLTTQNAKLSSFAKKALLKADAYREMFKEDMRADLKELVAEVINGVLANNVKDHIETGDADDRHQFASTDA